MKKFKLSKIDTPTEASTLLFAAWVQFFAEQRLGLQQRSGGIAPDGSGNFSFGDPTKAAFHLKRSPAGEWRLESWQEIPEPDIEAIVADARQKHNAGDFGGDVVYQTTMRAPAFDINPRMMSHFMRLLGDQIFISGRRRIGSRALLEFTPELPKDPAVPQLFAPATEIKVSIFTPGPTASDLTQRTAGGVAEIIGAICALALGRIVEIPRLSH